MQFHTATLGFILKVCNVHGEKVAIVKWLSQKCILNKFPKYLDDYLKTYW